MGRTNLIWMFWIYDRGMKLTIAITLVLRAARRQLIGHRHGRAY